MQRLSRYRHTSRTGTFFEAHRLAKRVLELHLAEREPCLQSGAQQKIVHTAKVEGQDRRCHNVPFQYAWHVRGKGRGRNTKTQHGAHAGSPTPQSTTGEALLMGAQQMGTGLQELAHGTRPMSSLEYKGYNKELQGKVFRGSIT